MEYLIDPIVNEKKIKSLKLAGNSIGVNLMF